MNQSKGLSSRAVGSYLIQSQAIDPFCSVWSTFPGSSSPSGISLCSLYWCQRFHAILHAKQASYQSRGLEFQSCFDVQNPVFYKDQSNASGQPNPIPNLVPREKWHQKCLLLHPMGIAAAAALSSGEGDICPLTPWKAFAPAMGLLESVPDMCQAALALSEVGHRIWWRSLSVPPPSWARSSRPPRCWGLVLAYHWHWML